jgi:hypothetical protein
LPNAAPRISRQEVDVTGGDAISDHLSAAAFQMAGAADDLTW